MTRTKYKRVPFDLKLAKKIINKEVKGRIVTEDNLPARIVCFDLKYGGSKILAALVDCGDYEIGVRCDLDGTCRDTRNEDNFNLHIEVPTYYKDYSNFVPQKWQPCLVRENDEEDWDISVCKGRNSAGEAIFFSYGCTYQHCLPLSKVTGRLVNTRKSYEELIQELDAESTSTNQEPDAELTSIIPDVEFEDDKQFDFHEIKTFEDACKRLGISAESLLVDSLGDTEAFLQANALYKLMIIQKAMNNGVWRDKDGWSYYPYWVLYSKEEMERMSEEEKQRKGIKRLLSCASADSTEAAGVRCAHAVSRGVNTFTYYGFPLCFNSEEAALYAAKQFEDLFFQYYGIKVKA